MSLINMERGIIVGRFQPPHLGHLKIFKYALDDVDELIVVIAAAQISHTKKNPFTAGERLLMLKKMLLNSNVDLNKIWLVPAEDIMDNALWVHHLKRLVPPFDVFFGNNPFTLLLFKEAGVLTKNTPLFNRDKYEATKIRQKIINQEDISDLVDPDVNKLLMEFSISERFSGILKNDSNEENSTSAGSELQDL